MSPDCRSHLEIAVQTNSGNIPDECNIEIQSILPSVLAKLGYDTNSLNENGEPIPASNSYDEQYQQSSKQSPKSKALFAPLSLQFLKFSLA